MSNEKQIKSKTDGKTDGKKYQNSISGIDKLKPTKSSTNNDTKKKS